MASRRAVSHVLSFERVSVLTSKREAKSTLADTTVRLWFGPFTQPRNQARPTKKAGHISRNTSSLSPLSPNASKYASEPQLSTQLCYRWHCGPHSIYHANRGRRRRSETLCSAGPLRTTRADSSRALRYLVYRSRIAARPAGVCLSYLILVIVLILPFRTFSKLEDIVASIRMVALTKDQRRSRWRRGVGFGEGLPFKRHNRPLLEQAYYFVNLASWSIACELVWHPADVKLQYSRAHSVWWKADDLKHALRATCLRERFTPTLCALESHFKFCTFCRFVVWVPSAYSPCRRVGC